MLDKYESGNSKVVESTSFMLQFKNGRFVTWDDLDDDGLRFELSGFRLREDRRLDLDAAREVEWRKAWRERNKEKLRMQRLLWEERNRDKLREYSRKRRDK